MAEIHPTALVDPGARLGEGVRIGPYCTVGPDVELGAGVELVSHVVVEGVTRVGEGVRAFPFVTIGMAPQHLRFPGAGTRTEIGARTILREHVTVHRGTEGGTGLTVVGSDCLLMCVTHIAHDCRIGDRVIFANNAVLGGHVEVGDNAVIGGAAAIHQFVRIGRQAMIGGASGVEGDVIPYGSALGNRARLAGLNVIGLKRRGFSKPQIHALRRAFRTLFQNAEGTLEQRAAGVEAELGAVPEVAEILAFLRGASHRPLCRARARATETEDELEDAA